MQRRRAFSLQRHRHAGKRCKPCQDAGKHIHLHVPLLHVAAGAVVTVEVADRRDFDLGKDGSLHSRIVGEWRG